MTQSSRHVWPVEVRRVAWVMTKAERRAFLRARGWLSYGYDAWRPPLSFPRQFTAYSLAAAIYTALEVELVPPMK